MQESISSRSLAAAVQKTVQTQKYRAGLRHTQKVVLGVKTRQTHAETY